MEKVEILNKIQRILKEELKIQVEITEETALVNEKVVDSMEFMNYITTVEEMFDVSISDDDIAAQQLGVVKNMVDYLSR